MNKIKLKEITSKIGSGATPRGGKNSYKSEGISLIRSMNVYDSAFEYTDLAFIDEMQAKELSNVQVERNDILLNITGASVARCCMVPDNILPARVNQHVAIIRIRQEMANPRYILYCLISHQYKQKLLAIAQGGATREALTKEKIEDFEILIPSLSNQHKIASILSAYDDLIENNNRRIKILEEMAKAIYREWFVNFRFPDHEKVKMVKSKLGMIPEGWEVKTLGDICTIVMGQSPKSEFYNEDGNGLPFHQGVTDFYDRFPADRIYCTVQNRIAEAGDILFSVRAPVGRINIANKRMVIGRGLCAIRSRTGNQSFVFQQLKDKFQETDTMGGGTIFKSVTKEDVHGIKMIVPSDETLNNFEESLQPFFRKLEIMYNKNNILRKTRDLLLPKLISGEIDVEGMKIEVNGTGGDI